MAERILVTGATGVVGRIAVPALVRLGHRVTAIGRSDDKRALLASFGAEPIALDMFDRDAARRALAGHTVVINLATHMPPSVFQTMLPWAWRENDRVRREGSASLVDAALATGVGRFIQESFAPVYEAAGDEWIDERWPVRPTRYNRTVLDAEHSARRFTAAGGTGIVLRFASFYGPDKFLGEMIKVVRRGWSPIPGRADAYWSSVAHEDAAYAVAAALAAPTGTYNVCDDEPITRREYADVLAAALGVKAPKTMPAWVTALGGSVMDLLSRSQRMSNASLKHATGWSPKGKSARTGLPVAMRALWKSG
jgi:2-alkyl-3-oxoalkanoate reductase